MITPSALTDTEFMLAQSALRTLKRQGKISTREDSIPQTDEKYIHWTRHCGRWKVCIPVDGNLKHCGYYEEDDLEGAIEARDYYLKKFKNNL